MRGALHDPLSVTTVTSRTLYVGCMYIRKWQAVLQRVVEAVRYPRETDRGGIHTHWGLSNQCGDEVLSARPDSRRRSVLLLSKGDGCQNIVMRNNV